MITFDTQAAPFARFLFTEYSLLQIDIKRRIDHAVLRHDPGDQTIRRDIEGNIARLRLDRCDTLPVELDPQHLIRIALFDGNQATMRERKIDGGSRGNGISGY